MKPQISLDLIIKQSGLSLIVGDLFSCFRMGFGRRCYDLLYSVEELLRADGYYETIFPSSPYTVPICRAGLVSKAAERSYNSTASCITSELGSTSVKDAEKSCNSFIHFSSNLRSPFEREKNSSEMY